MNTTETIAVMCHEANKTWCQLNGDYSQKSWDEAEQWQRDSSIAGVQFRLDNPEAPASAQHDSWMSAKSADRWQYGEVKDAVLKTHPCMVAYELLPEVDKRKDAIF